MSSHFNSWYCNRRWRRRRAHQLRVAPLCEECRKRGLVEAATIVDHVVSHRGDKNAFWTGALQSLCARCHDLKTKDERDVLAGRWQKGCDERGWPLDKRHPAWIERS